MRIALAALAAALVALAGTPVAAAGPILDAAAGELENDPVYVHRDAVRPLSADDEQALEEQIATAGAGPVYVAVLPDAARDEAGGDAGAVVEALYESLGRDGTYAVIVGDSLRAGSTELEPGEAGRLATEALEANGSEGVAATLSDFVTRVATARAAGNAGGGGGDDGGSGGLWFLLAIVAVPVGFLLWRRHQRRRQAEAELELVRAEADDDLVALAGDVQALELDVDMPGADPRAKEDYANALDAYARARAALDRARTPEELAAVSGALEEGRFAMSSARARLEGREPPEHRAPCFFDPRHGPSARDVLWAPPGGEPQPVPACAADAARIEQGLDPETREVTVGGSRVPYWQASPAFAPYGAGFFGGFGIVPAFLVGSMLGSGFGFPAGDPGGDGDFAGDGDYGGGDFGDFGGGDFGGGGGDFGGGGE